MEGFWQRRAHAGARAGSEDDKRDAFPSSICDAHGADLEVSSALLGGRKNLAGMRLAGQDSNLEQRFQRPL